MKNGDPSLEIVPHPRFGKMLIAKRDLPKGYKMALWGDVVKDHDMPEEDREWGFETADGWFINPKQYQKGAQLQFCQCPGPNEKVTVTFARPCLMMEDMSGKKKATEKYAAMLFTTLLPVPKNHQLVMMYAESEKATESFFKERGLTRCDVYTDKYPTVLKKNASTDRLRLKPKEDKPISKTKKKSIAVMKPCMK